MRATTKRVIALITLGLLVFQTTGLVSADHDGLPGLEETDGWVDVHGDTMHGDLDVGNHQVILGQEALYGNEDGELWYGSVLVCLDEQEDCAGLVWRGAWDSQVQYEVDDAVHADGSSWIAVQDNVFSPPGDGNPNWDVVAAAGAQGPQGEQGSEGPPGEDGSVNPIDCGSDRFIQEILTDGSADCGAAWVLGGNAGTNPSTDFIGTTDAANLTLRVDGERALLIIPGSTPTLVGGHTGNHVGEGVIGAVVAGGGGVNQENRVLDDWGTVGGGRDNRAGLISVSVDGQYATVGGGESNTAIDRGSTVGGGSSNFASGAWSTIGGGESNTASSGRSTVGGGESNAARGAWSTVSGGRQNAAEGFCGFSFCRYQTVAGGNENTASHGLSTVSGGFSNTASGPGSTVSGGTSNTANHSRSTVGGGESNTASHERSTVGGGQLNTASGEWSTVAGGRSNTASGSASTVGGGNSNTASGFMDTVGGGESNTASGQWNTVGGGFSNTASGSRSTVPGGQDNEASGAYSFAAGRQAKADHAGTFVWRDSATAGDDFHSTAANQFRVRAAGGVEFKTNSALTTGCSLAAGGGTWSCTSDRNAKENWKEVDGQDVLDRLTGMPVATWNYHSQAEDVVHMGPAAQDFHKAFGLGDDEKSISQVDSAGVALAAIQGLNEVVEQQNEEIRELEERLAQLQALVEDLADPEP